MATSPVARPQSHHSSIHLFPDDDGAPVQQSLATPPELHPPVHSHYRPFSTLHSDPPYVDTHSLPAPKPSRLKRASSVGAMQALSNMGISLSGKDKNSKARKESTPSSISKASAPKMPVSLKFKSRRSPGQDDTEGSVSSPSVIPRPSPTTLQMKKKRSMASLFSSSEVLVESGNGEPILGQRRSPLGSAHHVSTPPPSSLDHKAATGYKSVAFKESASDPDLSNIFLPKDVWSRRNNMILHPYHDRVPYMQAYNPILLDNDYHTDILLRHLSEGRPSFHDFGKKPPGTILDLGCGQGHWILYAASVWKSSQITGIDIVDITLPAFETTENIVFRQVNFLDKRLPFPTKSFDFVRMANLALCIPKDSWEHLLVEVYRVLAPGGRLEIIDDQLHFPLAKLPAPDPVRKTEPPSSFDIGDDDEREMLDGETLHGHESAETDSTLVSDNSRPSSFDGSDHPQLTESPTVRPFDAQLSDFAPPPIPPTPKSFQKFAAPARVYASQARRLALQTQTQNARDLEKIFRIMLRRQFSISYRPADRIVRHLQNIFGEDAAGKKFSFHVKLAPADSPIGPLAKQDKEETSSIKKLAYSMESGKKPWMGSEYKEKQRRKKEEKDSKKAELAAAEAEVTSRSSTEHSSFDGSSPPLPVSMNAKAAARLGLAVPISPSEVQEVSWPGTTPTSEAVTPTAIRNRRNSFIMTPPVTASFTAPPSAPAPKAAERLGLTWSSDGSPMNMNIEKLKNARKLMPALEQSPGLLVWPSTYIPMGPSELEMHACKNVHTLLGCRAALSDFVAMQTDETGKRMVSAAEFDDILWDYECFRRARLNWPSDISDPYDDDTINTSGQDAIPIKQLKLTGSAPTTPTVETSDSFNGQYRRDDLTHVRTIRVFHAVKPDGTLLGMFRSRSATTPGPP